MPRWASRLLLEIISARVDRLPDITEDDALAEGMQRTADKSGVESYRDLFESLNGDASWDPNPWVWVVVFRKVTA
jgi:hypothetical protein